MSDWTDARRYDDVGWHVEGALGAGQPEENAATHIGLYLAWLVRRDLHNPEFLSEELVAAVRNGEVSGSEALGDMDDKLVSDVMTPEAAAFSDWYYERYLDEFGTTFEDAGDYGVIENDVSSRAVSELLDRRMEEWRTAGRPEAPARPLPDLDALKLSGPIRIGIPSRETWENFGPGARVGLETLLEILPQGTEVFEMRPPPAPHRAPELEALIPAELGETSSVSLSKWHGMPMVKRALKRLGVSPARAHIAHLSSPLPGRRGALTILLYSVPGVAADRLDEEFRPAFKQPRDLLVSEDDRTVAGRTVHWQHAIDWVTAWWCRDGLVVSASGPDDATLEDLVRKLP